MEGNQVSLTRMMLNIATPSDQGISFARGEILQGTVQEVRSDGLVVMLLKGRLIEAATEVMVKSGQQLFLMVDDFRDGKTYLKVLSPERMEKVENASLSANLQNIGIPAREDTVAMARKLLQHNLPVTPNNLSEMVKGLNLLGGANQRHLEVVAFALSRNLPVSQPVLSALLQFTDSDSNLGKLLGTLVRSLNPGELSRPAADQMPRQAVPMPESLTLQPAANNTLESKAASRSQVQPPMMHNSESVLNNTVANRPVTVLNSQAQQVGAETERITLQIMQSAAKGEVPPSGESQSRAVSGQQIPAAERASGLISTSPDLDESAPTSVNRPASERSGQGVPERVATPVMPSTQSDGEEAPVGTPNRPVTEKADLQQIMPDKMIPRPNTEVSAMTGGERVAGISAGIKSETEFLKLVELIRPLLDILQTQASDEPAVTAAKVQSLLQSEKEIVRGLILLEDIIKVADNESKSPLLTELLGKIEGMEKELSGQRIFNYLSRIPDSNLNYYYFSFPVKFDHEYRLCQLRINREAGKKILKDQDTIKFIVSLDTAKMGMVLFHVNWKRNNTLTLQGVVEREKVMHYLNQNMEQLLTGLGHLGYSVTNLGVRVVRKDEQIDGLRPQMEEVPVKIRPFSIDVTV